jgi:hypothetical protein
MKKLISFLLILGLIASADAFAQKSSKDKTKSEDKIQKAGEVKTNEVPQVKKRSIEERADILTKYMIEELNLNPDQAKKVHAANYQATKEIDFLRENRQTKARTFKSEIKAAYDNRENSIRAALTPQQLVTYDANKKKMREIRKAD